MSAADLVGWLKHQRAQGAENVPGTGVCDLVTCARTEKVTPKNDPLRGRNGVCDLVTAVTPFLVGVEVERMKSRPQRSDPYAIGASWRPLAADYYRHHFTCPSCCAAGHGRGDRCTTGADLWASYEAASDAAHDTSTKGRNAR